MVKSFSLLFCIFLTTAIPSVILCKPQPQQDQPQISPPRPSSGISTFPVAPPSDTNDSTVLIGNDVLPPPPAVQAAGSGSGIGNHVQPGVIVHEPIAPQDENNGTQPPRNPEEAVNGCPKIYRPLCGSDSKTYNSPCEFRIAQRSDSTLEQAKSGVC